MKSVMRTPANMRTRPATEWNTSMAISAPRR